MDVAIKGHYLVESPNSQPVVADFIPALLEVCKDHEALTWLWLFMSLHWLIALTIVVTKV